MKTPLREFWQILTMKIARKHGYIGWWYWICLSLSVGFMAANGVIGRNEPLAVVLVAFFVGLFQFLFTGMVFHYAGMAEDRTTTLRKEMFKSVEEKIQQLINQKLGYEEEIRAQTLAALRKIKQAKDEEGEGWKNN